FCNGVGTLKEHQAERWPTRSRVPRRGLKARRGAGTSDHLPRVRFGQGTSATSLSASFRTFPASCERDPRFLLFRERRSRFRSRKQRDPPLLSSRPAV